VSAKILAAVTSASPAGARTHHLDAVDYGAIPRIEMWPILAINKFDSDLKRMSVLEHFPPKVGSNHMLLCKGADPSMLKRRSVKTRET
jgi:magnesium-transporting ATPase (P-type)